MENNSAKHWSIFVMCCLLAVVGVGIPVMTAGIFITPIANNLNMLRGTVAIHNTMTLIFKAILALYSPKVIEKLSIKKTFMLGTLLIAGSTYLMGWSESIWLFNILGVLRGIGAGLIAWVPITLLVNNWFEKKNGLITSIVLSFSSVGGAVLSPLFTQLIQNLGWAQSYRLMGITAIVLALPAFLLSYSLNPTDIGLLPYGATPNDETKTRTVITRDQQRDISKELFYLFLTFGLLQTLAIGIPQHFPGFVETINYPQTFGASLMSATMISSIVFKVGSGYVSDRIGSIKTTYFIMTCTIIASTIFVLVQDRASLFLAAIIIGGIFAIPSVALVLLTKRFFGLYNFAQSYPKVSFAVSIGGSISVSAIGFIYDFTGNYIIAFIALILINIICFGILIYLMRKYLTN